MKYSIKTLCPRGLHMIVTAKTHPLFRCEAEQAAHRAADADRSDPFARARMQAHIEQGIVSRTFRGNELLSDDLYDAKGYMETRRLPASGNTPGETYQVLAYNSRVRP